MHQLTPIGLASDTLMTAALLASHALIDPAFSSQPQGPILAQRIQPRPDYQARIYRLELN